MSLSSNASVSSFPNSHGQQWLLTVTENKVHHKSTHVSSVRWQNTDHSVTSPYEVVSLRCRLRCSNPSITAVQTDLWHITVWWTAHWLMANRLLMHCSECVFLILSLVCDSSTLFRTNAPKSCQVHKRFTTLLHSVFMCLSFSHVHLM